MLVVDNASTDGTGEWLQTQPVTAETLAENTGGAGGFSHGLERAVESGADLAWLMDDDGLPEPDCLKLLLEREDLDFWGPAVLAAQDPTGSASRSGCPAAPRSCTRWPRSRRPRRTG